MRVTRIALPGSDARKVPPAVPQGETGGSQQETRDAAFVAAGEPLSVSVTTTRGGRAVFSWAVAASTPPVGHVVFTVTLDGTPVYTKRVFAGRTDRWHSVTIPFERDGSATLAMTTAFSHGSERRQSRPGVLVAAPRLYLPGPPARRRVLIWISQDALRADHLGAYGYRRATSASFDGLGKAWAVFDAAVASAPWTLPSMTSQFTSRHPSSHGATLTNSARKDVHPTIADALSRAGFTVLGVTGNTFISADFNMADGFDVLYYTPGAADDVNRLVARALEDWPGGDLALFVHYMDPHDSYAPPAPYDTAFDPAYRGAVTGSNFYALARSPEDVAHVSALYDGEIAFADSQIGVLFRDLDKRGILDDAVIVYSADHGEELKDHGGWTHSQTLYEEVLHVPFALRIPGVAPRRIAEPVSLLDLAPTILDALGVPAPGSFQGHSLLPLLHHGGRPREPIFSETDRNPGNRNHKLAVREGSLKYVLVAPRGRESEDSIVREEVFDLARDPEEQHPLASPPELQHFRRIALDHIALARRGGPQGDATTLPSDVEERLRSLGYLQ